MKFKNVHLLIILVVLAAAWGIFELTSTRGRGDLPEVLASCDYVKANRIEIEKMHGRAKIVLIKEPTGWKLETEAGKKVETEKGKADILLQNFKVLKPVRLAGTKESKWGEFQVDTTGTRLKIFHEGEEEPALDVVVGAITTIGDDKVFTYIRLPEEEETYTVSGFLIKTLQTVEGSWRNQIVIDTDPWAIKSVTLTYPADSSMVLEKNEAGSWTTNGVLADSLKVEEYIKMLSKTTFPYFDDDIDPESLGQPLQTAVVQLEDRAITVLAYTHPDKGFLVRSTENGEALFADQPRKLVEKIFVSQYTLMGLEAPDQGHEGHDHDHDHHDHEH